MTVDGLRRDVALANHILERLGLAGATGHASARIGDGATFLLPTRRSPALASADQLLTLDTDCRVLDGAGEPNSEMWIHSSIYVARPEVGAVVHAHPPSCIALTALGEAHRVVHNAASIFADGVPVHGTVELIRTREQGDSLARTLSGHSAAILLGHGAVVVGRDIREATVAACLLEESARLQLAALAARGVDRAELRSFTREEADRVRAQMGDAWAERMWEYYAWLAR